MQHDLDILKKCNSYLDEETDNNLKNQIIILMQKNDELSIKELKDRMDKHLEFGTAGVRARMEAGYNRLNLVSIHRFFCALAHEFKLSEQQWVVVGFDARNNSFSYAQEAGRVLCALGIRVYLFETCVPTPLLAYATKKMHASLGIMITASHNPAEDNGIKLFQADSSQLSGPMLTAIQNRIPLVAKRNEFWSTIKKDSLGHNPLIVDYDEIEKNYLHDIKHTQLVKKAGDIKLVYTPLHGVGGQLFLKAVSQENFNQVITVQAQSNPDGNFPTVSFPNPEEEHTLDLAHALALCNNFSYVIAHDPDADRLQVSTHNSSGVFTKLSGNEMGAILAYFAISKAHQQGIKPLIASSIVSSRLVEAMCVRMNALYTKALTGFSTIVHQGLKIQKSNNCQLVFAYEEAIGFLVGTAVLDKDGINAGIRFMEILSYLESQHKTIWDLLDDFALQFGLFINTQWSMRFSGADSVSAMKQVMAKIRQGTTSAMAWCFGEETIAKYDLNEKQQNNEYSGICADVVIFQSAKTRFIARPSGTEPKIKFYLETCDYATDRQVLSNKRLELQKNLASYRSNVEKMLGA